MGSHFLGGGIVTERSVRPFYRIARVLFSILRLLVAGFGFDCRCYEPGIWKLGSNGHVKMCCRSYYSLGFLCKVVLFEISMLSIGYQHSASWWKQKAAVNTSSYYLSTLPSLFQPSRTIQVYCPRKLEQFRSIKLTSILPRS